MITPWVSFDGKDCSGYKHLNNRGYCEFTACIIPCTVSATIPEVKPKTNADRIRSMTDEELAEYLFERGNGDEYCYGICVHQDDVNACVKALKQDGCIQSVVAWLKQEYTP